MPDLLNIQRAEGQPARFSRSAAWHLDPQDLQRLQQVQHRAVGNGKWPLTPVPSPVGRRGTALQKRIPLRVEQAAAVGRQVQPVVMDAVVHRPESGQQAAPGVKAAFQHLFPLLIGGLSQLSS